jgi:hypothetical protein
MDRKKFIKTSPEWHDLLDFIGKDWQFDCPSGQHAEQHPSLISLVFTETIDGKNNMHSMARAVFQVVQDHTPTSEISLTKIKRGEDRSLSMTEETTSLME